MSLTEKLLIPLVSNVITINDLSPELGFVDAYTHDKNDPSLDRHLFLMYKRDTSTTEKWKLHNKLKNDPNLYCRKIYRINNIWYVIYVYLCTYENLTMYFLQNNANSISPESAMKIIAFWKNTDDRIKDLIFNSATTIYKTTGGCVPERDFILPRGFQLRAYKTQETEKVEDYI